MTKRETKRKVRRSKKRKKRVEIELERDAKHRLFEAEQKAKLEAEGEAKREKEKREEIERERDAKHQLNEAEQKAKREALQLIEDLQKQLTEVIKEPSHRANKDKEKAEKERDEATTSKETETRMRREAEEKAQKAEEDSKAAEQNLHEKEDKFKEALKGLTTAIGQIRLNAQQGTKDAIVEIQQGLKRDEQTLRGTTPGQPAPHGSGGQDDSDSADDDDQIVGAPILPKTVDEITGKTWGKTTKTTDGVIQLKLETISLPYFSGDLTEWVSFRDFFEYLVHKNSNLSDTFKFHQLRSHLRGTAFDTIQEYIRRFLEISAILQKPTFTKVRAIIDGTNQMLRAIPTLSVDVNNWDPFVNLIIITKMDEDTRTEWKQRLGKKVTSSVGELLDFLET